MALVKRVDHVNVQVPPEKEEDGLRFYGELLGLKRLKKPDSLGPAGGHFCLSEEPWYELHLGVARGTSLADVDVKNRLRNHLALQVEILANARAKFEAAGVEIIEAEAAYSKERNFHQDRFFVRDPGGNLLEILEPRRVYDSVPH